MRNFVLCSFGQSRKNVCNKVKIFNLQFGDSRGCSAGNHKTVSCPEKSRNLDWEQKKKTKRRQRQPKWEEEKGYGKKKVIDGNCSNCHVYERPQDTKPTERETWGGRRREGDWGRGKLWLQCARNATAILQSGEGSSTHRIRNALTWPGLGGFGLLWLPNQGRIEVCGALALTFLEPLL